MDEEEGDLFMGELVLEDEEEEGGGGNSPRELLVGGGGNSGDCGATTLPGCHFGLALTAGGDRGAAILDPSMLELGAGFPGN